jgi:hypothetical protein
MCFTQVGSGLTHKHKTRQEIITKDRYSSSLQTFVNYDRKKFHNIGPARTSTTTDPSGPTRTSTIPDNHGPQASKKSTTDMSKSFSPKRSYTEMPAAAASKRATPEMSTPTSKRSTAKMSTGSMLAGSYSHGSFKFC